MDESIRPRIGKDRERERENETDRACISILVASLIITFVPNDNLPIEFIACK